MNAEEELKAETAKWFEKARKAANRADAKNKKGEEMLANIQAYLNDSIHFSSNGKAVQAFEAVVWAWALLEMGREFGVLEF